MAELAKVSEPGCCQSLNPYLLPHDLPFLKFPIHGFLRKHLHLVIVKRMVKIRISSVCVHTALTMRIRYRDDLTLNYTIKVKKNKSQLCSPMMSGNESLRNLCN